ncbi:hypothetical protein CEW46_32635 [Bacillus cereus]|nr:hypothetical protein CEW46_32635 [Bacillus cereus]
MLTVEDYCKWYDLFIIDNDKVYPVSWDNDILLDYWRDHCIVPEGFRLLAQDLGCTYDEATWNAVVKMHQENM